MPPVERSEVKPEAQPTPVTELQKTVLANFEQRMRQMAHDLGLETNTSVRVEFSNNSFVVSVVAE